jgi:hypothetical protein
MIDDNLYCEGLGHFGYVGFPVRYMERIRELRVLSKATSKRLAEMEKDLNNEGEITKERTLLKAIQGELSRLERRAIFSEMHIKWP